MGAATRRTTLVVHLYQRLSVASILTARCIGHQLHRGRGDVERISRDCSPVNVGFVLNERRPNLLNCQIWGYSFVNMHVKLLSSEAFFNPKCSKYRSAPSSARTHWGGAYCASLDHLVGLRGHLLYDIHAVASQRTVKMWLK